MGRQGAGDHLLHVTPLPAGSRMGGVFCSPLLHPAPVDCHAKETKTRGCLPGLPASGVTFTQPPMTFPGLKNASPHGLHLELQN